jgi:DNA (cytosine-5)-methyltransferase 1
LQGFPDGYRIPVSDTQAYKQFGNAVAVPVIEILAKALVKTLVEKPKRKTPYTIQAQL